MNRLRIGAVVAALAAMWVAGSLTSPAGAIAPDAYGWWAVYQQAPGGSNLPTPPGVPDDGIFVNGVPQTQGGQSVGVAAFGAIRVVIGEGSPARLLLSVAAGSSAANAVLLACPTTSSWDGFVNGRWEARPSYDCVRGVQGVVAPTGDMVVFDLAGTIQKSPGLLDVAIVPGGPVRVAFNRPGPSSVQPAMEKVSSEENMPSDEAPVPAGDPTFDPGSGFTGGFEAPLNGDAFTSLPAFEPDSSLAAGVLAPTETASPAVGLEQAFPDLVGVPVVRFADERGERIMAVGILALLAAGLWWIGGQQTRAPRRLGSLALGGAETAIAEPMGTRLAGIGRFARQRTAAPPNRL